VKYRIFASLSKPSCFRVVAFLPNRLRQSTIGSIIVYSLFIFGCVDTVDLPDITGVYVADHNSQTTLQIRLDHDNTYTIVLSGGGSANSTVVPADCEIKALGTLEGKKILARFTALETETFTYDERTAEKEGRTLEILFAPCRANVIHADTFGYCGLGADFTGKYNRIHEQAH
jgi:hypothetical protein